MESGVETAKAEASIKRGEFGDVRGCVQSGSQNVLGEVPFEWASSGRVGVGCSSGAAVGRGLSEELLQPCLREGRPWVHRWPGSLPSAQWARARGLTLAGNFILMSETEHLMPPALSSPSLFFSVLLVLGTGATCTGPLRAVGGGRRGSSARPLLPLPHVQSPSPAVPRDSSPLPGLQELVRVSRLFLLTPSRPSPASSQSDCAVTDLGSGLCEVSARLRPRLVHSPCRSLCTHILYLGAFAHAACSARVLFP